MPTVSSIVSQATSVAHLGTKLFNGNRAAANQSVLVGPGYGNFLSYLSSDFGGQPAITNLVENYTDNRESFNENFRENLAALQEATNKVKESAEAEIVEKAVTSEISDIDNDNNTGASLSTLGEFANGNIPPELRNALQIQTQPQAHESIQPEAPKAIHSLQDFAKTYLTSERIQADVVENVPPVKSNSRVSAVQNLVHDFNSAIDYLYKNRSVSARLATLADKFGNNLNLSNSLNSVGISMDSKGFLSLNASIFSDALERDAQLVNSAVGSEGLAGQLEKNINLANAQEDRLFTSLMDFANNRRQDESESLYGNNAAYAVENTPRLFAMFT